MLAYEVVRGDCLSSIAHRYGFTWQTLWNLPENAAFKAKRKNPNVIYPGDIVMIPVKEQRLESRPVDATHRFRMIGGPTSTKVRLLYFGVPRTGVPCTFKFRSREVARTTDDQGFVEAYIQPDEANATLYVHDVAGTEVYPLVLGGLDPIDTLSGQQQRLRNMGYSPGNAETADDVFTSAITLFQNVARITVDGIVGPQTRGALHKAHGS